MDPVLVVSPHLDDAVLSLGQFLGGWPGAIVLTVFSGIPEEKKVTTFDVSSEFHDSTQAMTARWHEDDRAMRVLDCKAMRLGMMDNQYRDPEEGIDLDAMIDGIRNSYTTSGAIKLIGPLGLAHSDHEVTNKACMIAAKDMGVPIWLYEDVPARVLWPEQVSGAVKRAEDFGFTSSMGFLGSSDLALKKEAVACYQSQLWALDQHVIYVPERVWQMDPA